MFLPDGRLPREQVGRPTAPSGHGIVAFDLPFYFIFGLAYEAMAFSSTSSFSSVGTRPCLSFGEVALLTRGGEYEGTEWIGYDSGVIFDSSCSSAP